MRDRLEYRELGRQDAAAGRTILAICRWNLRIITRHKLFWALFVIGLLHFLVHYVLIYIKAEIAIESPEFAKFIDSYQVTGTGDAYRIFLEGQARAVLILMAYAGVVLVTADFRSGGIAFYLTKPVDRLEYILGKALALWILVGMLTLVPAVVLYLEYGFFSNSIQYWIDNPRVLWGIFGYSMLIMLVPSILLLAVGAACRRAAPFLMVWCAIFLILPAFGGLLARVFNHKAWLLVNQWRNLWLLGQFFFGSRDPNFDNNIIFAGLLIMALLVGCMVALRRMLRAVEVVE